MSMSSADMIYSLFSFLGAAAILSTFFLSEVITMAISYATILVAFIELILIIVNFIVALRGLRKKRNSFTYVNRLDY